MAEIAGLGRCAICHGLIQDPKTGVPSPIRHFAGHQLAHKTCMDDLDALKKTKEYQVQQAKQKLGQAKNKVKAAEAEVKGAEETLARLEADDV